MLTIVIGTDSERFPTANELTKTDRQFPKFSDADLRHANLEHAKLIGANLARAESDGTTIDREQNGDLVDPDIRLLKHQHFLVVPTVNLAPRFPYPQRVLGQEPSDAPLLATVPFRGRVTTWNTTVRKSDRQQICEVLI